MRKFGALNNEVVGSHTEQEWKDLLVAWGWRCFYCGNPVYEGAIDDASCATKDHLFPISRGGVDFIWNIVVACLRCNRLKGDRTVEEFREARPGICTGIPSVKTIEEAERKAAVNFMTQAVQFLSPRTVMAPQRDSAWYVNRKRALQQQAAEIVRLRLVDAGQMTLPIFGDGTAKKLAQSEISSLAFKGMDVTRKA